MSGATASGRVKTRDTVAGDTPARVATSRIDTRSSPLPTTGSPMMKPVSETVKAQAVGRTALSGGPRGRRLCRDGRWQMTENAARALRRLGGDLLRRVRERDRSALVRAGRLTGRRSPHSSWPSCSGCTTRPR
ncbi:hypothetical protein GCM10010472_00330 [Pseudonocardia halophobica]|uniref:Uncharacterized protein n=1 Tax=Pseudonocardia halophobica TaxID=29401 RepID=A0A9W6LB75_9PSEU|nr:hypothetical protein GCM10017577_60490 [Pseudonocardia halophobica]